MERVRVLAAKIGFDPADGKVHLGESPRRVVRLLTKDRDVVSPPTVSFDESLRLDEHACRSAARVIHPAGIGLDHFDKKADYPAGRIELTRLLAFGPGELAKEVLVRSTEDITRGVFCAAQTDIADEVDQLTEAPLV